MRLPDLRPADPYRARNTGHTPARRSPGRSKLTAAVLATLATLAAVAVGSQTPAQATQSTPRLNITSPVAVSTGSRVTVSATLRGIPTGQVAHLTMPGLPCVPVRAPRGAATVRCSFRAAAVGAHTLRASATLTAADRTVGTITSTSRITASGVSATVAPVVRRGQRTVVQFAVGAAWAPGTVVRLTPGVTGATGCPVTITLRLSSQGTATTTCTLTPQPTATLRVAPKARANARAMVAGAAVTRAILDAPAVSMAAAEKVWRQQTEVLWNLALSMPAVDHDAAATGFELRIRARRDGWDDPAVAALLQHLLELRNPDGGWGTQVAWDAFGNGTVNPVETSYTVTTAEHAGTAVLEAWQHGMVQDADLRAAVDSLLATPTWDVPGGRCMAYSSSTNDAGICVVNVSLGAAAWLKQVRAATGWSIPELDEFVAGATGAIRYLYDPATGYWAYSDLPRQRSLAQDARHQGYTLQSATVLDPELARSATALVLSRPWWAQPTTGPVSDFGNGLSQIAFTQCSATSSASLLEAFSTVRSGTRPVMTRFLALQGALYGSRVLGVCFTGQGW